MVRFTVLLAVYALRCIAEALRQVQPAARYRAPPPGQATALAHPTRKATADAASLRFDLARGSLRARFGRRAATPLSAPREKGDD
jgi:hypothetical protein